MLRTREPELRDLPWLGAHGLIISGYRTAFMTGRTQKFLHRSEGDFRATRVDQHLSAAGVAEVIGVARDTPRAPTAKPTGPKGTNRIVSV